MEFDKRIQVKLKRKKRNRYDGKDSILLLNTFIVVNLFVLDYLRFFPSRILFKTTHFTHTLNFARSTLQVCIK
jgi:hypothetical protein